MAACMLRRGMAVFSTSAFHHNSVARGSCILRQRALASNRCIHVSPLTQASIGKRKQVDGHRRRGFLPPLCVNSPGSGQIDSEEPSDDIRNPEVPDKTVSQCADSSATIDQFAEPLPRGFLTESVNGEIVECNGRGCRPLYKNVLAEYRQLGNTNTGACLTDVEKSAVRSAFHAAFESTPDDARLVWEYAMFSWKSLCDIDAAKELFDKALQLAPHDTNILASHARFRHSLPH